MTTSKIAAVTVIGNDRPGIVASVTRVLFELGCNLLDATSTILTGHFSMMLVVELGEGVTPERIEEQLARVADELGLVVTARPVHDAHLSPPLPTHAISVYGGDRPGIVYKVAEHLAARGVNITDLSSRMIGPNEHPIYALMMEVAAPPGEDLEADLADLRSELGVDISINPVDADIL